MSETEKGTDAGPVTLRNILDEAGDEFLSWDRGLLGTVSGLCTRPAEVARAYLFERSRRYVRPLRYLVVSIALSVLASWWVLDQQGMREHLGASTKAIWQGSLLLEHAAIITLIVLPLVAGAMRLLFHGMRVRYVDALVVLAYSQAQVNLFQILAVAWLAAIGNSAADLPVSLLAAAYLLWSWASFAQGPAWRRWLAAVLTLVAGQLINGVIVVLAIRLLGDSGN